MDDLDDLMDIVDSDPEDDSVNDLFHANNVNQSYYVAMFLQRIIARYGRQS